MAANNRKHAEGFTLVELVAVIMVGALALPILMSGVFTGTETVVKTAQSDRAHLLAFEQLEMIRNAGYWIDNVDTASPKLSGNPYDLATKWKARLDADGRAFSAKVAGTVSVTFLKGANLQDFAAVEFDGNNPRNKMRIKVTVQMDKANASIETYQMVYPSKKKLLSVLRRIKLALFQYNAENGNFPATDSLDVLVPKFLAEIPSDPYTSEQAKSSHKEEEGDYTYINSGGARELYTKSNPSDKLTW